MKSLNIALGVLVLASSFSVPAFAATSADDAGFSPDGIEQCSFQADAGGYVCEQIDGGYSLSELSDGPQKKKLSVSVIPVKPVVTPAKP